MTTTTLPKYDRHQSYEWNYDHAPEALEMPVRDIPGTWTFCGLPVNSPLGIPAGPLLNGKWCLYYASLGFDVVTYKTVRSLARECYPLPNLQPVNCGPMRGGEDELPAVDEMDGSWAVSFGMPSKEPYDWRTDVRETRNRLPVGQLLSVSVVASVQPDWTLDQLADDYAQCAAWAVEAGADCIETNFSCPNVSTCDGQLYQQPEDAVVVAQRVRERIGGVPFIIKIGHVSESGAAETLVDRLAPHVDAFAMTNSIATSVRKPDGQLLFDGEKRGICGAATFDASRRQTELVRDIAERQGADLALIGVGGASSAEHVKAYLNAGAHAVHMATAAMHNPLVGIEIRRNW